MDPLLSQLSSTAAEAVKERVTDPVTDPEVLIDKLSKIITHLDSSNLARKFGDSGSADAAIQCAKRLALELLGLT